MTPAPAPAPAPKTVTPVTTTPKTVTPAKRTRKPKTTQGPKSPHDSESEDEQPKEPEPLPKEPEPPTKKKVREVMEDYISSKPETAEIKRDHIITVSENMSDELLVKNIKEKMAEFQNLLKNEKLCDDTLELAGKIGAKDDPLEEIKANKEKFLAYILIATVARSARKDKTVKFEGKWQPIDEYRKKAIGERGGTDERSRKQMFTNRRDAGIAYEQFFLQADDTFKLSSIPQVTSLATELGRVSSAVLDKTKGKFNGQTFRPHHIPAVWKKILSKFKAQPPFVTFKKELHDELFGPPEEGQSGEGTKKESLKSKCQRALKQLSAMKQLLIEKGVSITDEELIEKMNNNEDDVDAADVLIDISRITPSPPGSTGSTVSSNGSTP